MQGMSFIEFRIALNFLFLLKVGLDSFLQVLIIV